MKPVNILGISAYYHDSAACLVRDGEIVAAAQEERFTRVKHDPSFPSHAVSFCLREGGLTSQDLDYVAFYEKPLVKFERILMTTLGGFPRTYPVFRESMVAWFNEKLWAKSKLRAGLDIDPKKILFVEHHLSHAASTLFASPFEEAAVLTIDHRFYERPPVAQLGGKK
jgi:carbamoyltransferase